MRPLEDVRREVLDAVSPLPKARVALEEALGLVLADPVRAPHDVPPFDNSAMDGYALRAEDTRDAPVTLPVVADLPAGRVAGARVEPGTAVRIMTGAPVPAGVDAVIQVELTRPGDGEVQVLESVGPGENLRPAGGDVREGETVFGEGERITPAHLGVLASLGIVEPTVHRRPQVAILSTGDEIVPPETERLEPGLIRDSNRPLLRGLLAELGAGILDLGSVGDDPGLLRKRLDRGAAQADAVVTTGGVSMGEYDLVKAILREAGGVGFWEVAMQPAKPFGFGSIEGTPFFGLPGNPVSVMVGFEQFVRPALLRMMGSRLLFRPRVRGRLGGSVRTNPQKTVFLRVRTDYRDGTWWAELSGGQSSNVLSTLARADAFAVVPVGTADLEEGATVDLEMFRWPEGRADG